MALETLAGIEEIGGVKIHRINWAVTPGSYIEICDDNNAITFNIQNGPIKEVGVNGCQVDHMVMVARHIISELNRKFPCR